MPVAMRVDVRGLVTGVVIAVAVAMTPSTGAAKGGPDAAFTIGKYPVDATAADAVTAKEKALADGQQAALRSLFKRLVPVTHYARLKRMQPPPRAADFLDGVGVQSESNSTTRYLASLDFSFRAEQIRELLRRENIPFVDSQAPVMTVLPVFREATAGAQLTKEDAAAWASAWQSLDQEHALTPFRVASPRRLVPADTISGVMAGDNVMIRALATELGSELVLVAVAEPDPSTRKVAITIAGQDGVGAFALKRVYRYVPGDLAYTLELAAVIALGTIEGRWKVLKTRGQRVSSFTSGDLGGNVEPVQLFVEYRSLQEWSDLRQTISGTPGVQDLQIGGLSARGADIALRFPGGAEALADQLRAQGLAMQGASGLWTVRSSR
jgi:hypothetical protein